MKVALVIAAIVAFVLAALGLDLGSLSAHDIGWLGLAAWAGSTLVP